MDNEIMKKEAPEGKEILNFPMSISIGISRSDTHWVNQEITVGQLEERLSSTKRTEETMEEYRAMKPSEQGEIKDIGGYVLGTLRDGKRSKETVVSRSALVLDIDNGEADTLDYMELCFCYYTIVYSTHKHTSEKPRLRLIIPLLREVSPDEYNAAGRIVADKIGINLFDPTTFEPSRLMYWPSTSKDGEYVFRVLEGELADPDEILAEVQDWRDCMSLPMLESEKGNLPKSGGKKVANPLEKKGIVGDFCAAYPIRDAIDVFLPDVYEPTDDPNRYKYIPAESTGGLIIHDDTMTVTSYHATDPLNGRGSPNAFDMVRIHLFGAKDAESPPDTPVTKLPSYQAMCDMVRNDVHFKEVNLKRRREKAAEELGFSGSESKKLYGDVIAAVPMEENSGSVKGPDSQGGVAADSNDGGSEENQEWIRKIEFDRRGKVANTIPNLLYILANDPNLKNIRFNMLGLTVEICGPVPWGHPSRFWRDADDAQLISYLEVSYGPFSERNYRTALSKVCDDRSYHPVLDYLSSIPAWDGVERVDTLFVDCLGADDTPYVRAVTRKMFVAAVARVMKPGCKFDTMTVLVGPQGCGKSTCISRMAGPWFNDSLQLGDTKDKTAAEKLQGTWIMEIQELAGMKKTDVEVLKGFLSRQDDIFREAYGRRTMHHPRQCIFFATTNSENGFLRDTTGNRRFWPVDAPGFGAGSPKYDEGRKQRGAHPSWELTQKEVDQIWAEVLVYYKNGESLILPHELNEEAIRQQRAAMETDDRESMVVEYLDKLLPENWDDMTLFQRRDFISGGQFSGGNLIGTVRRTRVCNQEIWCECFGRDRGSITRTDSNAIISMMQRIPGWRRAPNKQRVKGYGVVTVYERVDEDDEEESEKRMTGNLN